MATVAEALAFGLQQHKSGNLQAAEHLYRQILAIEPNHAEAWHLLGMIASQIGQYENALEYFQRAIQFHGTESAFHSNLGEVYRRLGRTSEAIDCFKKALQLQPNSAETHNNLGIALKTQGRLHDAITAYRRAIQLECNRAEYFNNLGNALRETGQLAEAIESLQASLRLMPDFAEAHNNLGNALQEQGKLSEAIAEYRSSLQLARSAVTFNDLGNALRDQGQIAAAISSYRQSLLLEPKLAEAHNNLGNALTDRGQFAEAIACFEKALQYKPGLIDAQNNLGNANQQSELALEAIACYRKTLAVDPDNLVALTQILHSLQHICCWVDLQKIAERIIRVSDHEFMRAGQLAMPPFAYLTLPITTSAQQQFEIANKWVAQQSSWAADREDFPLSSLQSKSHELSGGVPPKITLGYLSADFHDHATAYLIAEMFEEHDRNRFNVIGYSYGPDDKSPMRQRIINGVDRFRELRDSNYAEAARLIANDEVDILIDLKGYTQRARPQILALRPAPIQVSYLGYPGTMGGSFMDYILVDHHVVSADQQPFYTEKFVQMPGCYQVNDSGRLIAPNTPTRLECNLPENGFVFCSFNNNYKITPVMFEVWMRLLKTVPGSVLWLLEGNRFAPDNLRREAESRGVAQERLFFAPRQKLPEHLARHRLADLFLDTFPYNSHTTASDALWAGCPIVTQVGRTFISRVAASLLHTVGLQDLITTSIEDYENLALGLARDPARLTEVRSRLKTNRLTCGLFDGKRFARKAEKAYLKMWEIYKSGQSPSPFAVEE